MKKLTKMLIVAVAVLLAGTTINAQTTGSLSGSVSDPNGAAVAGASVTVKNPATGDERKVTTNERGAFSFDLINPGTYLVTVENAGFKKTVASGVVVQVSKETQLPITLEIGVASETVTVTSAQDIVNSSSPTLTNVIDTRQVVDLPLGDRNPVNLAGLQAGIGVVGENVRGASVGGLRQTAVNLTQDGINAMDNFVKTSSFFAISTPSLNSTAEFSITTGTVGADAGRGLLGRVPQDRGFQPARQAQEDRGGRRPGAAHRQGARTDPRMRGRRRPPPARRRAVVLQLPPPSDPRGGETRHTPPSTPEVRPQLLAHHPSRCRAPLRPSPTRGEQARVGAPPRCSV